MLRLRTSILVVLVLAGCLPPSAAPEAVGKGRYRFVCPARRGKVALAGDFNAWRPQRMTKRAGGAELVIALRPGAYAYACVYGDGRFEPPPDAPAYVDDGFGGRNGWIVIAPGDP